MTQYGEPTYDKDGWLMTWATATNKSGAPERVLRPYGMDELTPRWTQFRYHGDGRHAHVHVRQWINGVKVSETGCPPPRSIRSRLRSWWKGLFAPTFRSPLDGTDNRRRFQ